LGKAYTYLRKDGSLWKEQVVKQPGNMGRSGKNKSSSRQPRKSGVRKRVSGIHRSTSQAAGKGEFQNHSEEYKPVPKKQKPRVADFLNLRKKQPQRVKNAEDRFKTPPSPPDPDQVMSPTPTETKSPETENVRFSSQQIAGWFQKLFEATFALAKKSDQEQGGWIFCEEKSGIPTLEAVMQNPRYASSDTIILDKKFAKHKHHRTLVAVFHAHPSSGYPSILDEQHAIAPENSSYYSFVLTHATPFPSDKQKKSTRSKPSETGMVTWVVKNWCELNWNDKKVPTEPNIIIPTCF